MIKTTVKAMAMLRVGARISRGWGGFKIEYPGGMGTSILPKLVTQLEEERRIKRSDDHTSRVGEEWVVA